MKITQEQQKQGKEFLESLIQEAWSNSEFKERLIQDPKKSIEALTNRPFNAPNNKKIVVEDQTDNSFIYLNIPPKPDFSNIELSDEQLEQVAGGEIGLTGWIIISAVILVAGVGTGYAIGEAVKD